MDADRKFELKCEDRENALAYKAMMADTIYQDVFFSISSDQFPDDADLTHEVDGRIHEEDDAREQAQKLANTFNQEVEVAVYGTWGYYGREYIESFKVRPEARVA